MNESFDRLLNLAQKTNSRLIVYDRVSGKHLVVMGIDDFENFSAGKTLTKIVDDDIEKDQVLIQKLNQEISEWRNRAQKQEAANTVHDLSEEAEVENKISESLTLPVTSMPPTSSSWHKLGDVMAGYQSAPKMPEVRYEPNQTLVAEIEKTDSLDDDPIFLEEAVE